VVCIRPRRSGLQYLVRQASHTEVIFLSGRMLYLYMKGVGYLCARYAHYDNKKSFSDWTNFGGWTSPHAKQYNGDVTVCG
jgi:hypothetical protein